MTITYQTDSGHEWSYTEGGTRIYGNGEEINIWDHAKGAPGIEFTPEAVKARVTEWTEEEE
jgi:hypothetical protein